MCYDYYLSTLSYKDPACKAGKLICRLLQEPTNKLSAQIVNETKHKLDVHLTIYKV